MNRNLLSLLVVLLPLYCSGQHMLGYSTQQGDYYVYDDDRQVHLEHQQILSAQPAANSIAYITNTGDLKYYARHNLSKLDISNPSFYRNTDYYLYYSTGGNFSVFNGIEKKYLGNIQHLPYAFGDSIAAVHDFSAYFYAYVKDKFIELEQHPIKKVEAGDNLLAYVNHIDQFKIFYHYEKFAIDDYAPVKMKAAANTVAFINNYNDLKVFYNGKVYELYNLPELICLELPGSTQTPDLPDYCDAEVVYDVESSLPLFKAGDDMVAYIDDNGRFFVFYKGNIVALEQQPPLSYEIVDNVLYYADNNNYFKIFMDGELTIAETFIPATIKADKDVVVYTDLDKRLKAFYNGEVHIVSSSIVLDFEVNQSLIMYNDLPYKYKFYSRE